LTLPRKMLCGSGRMTDKTPSLLEHYPDLKLVVISKPTRGISREQEIVCRHFAVGTVRLQVFFGEFVRLLYFCPVHVPLLHVCWDTTNLQSICNECQRASRSLCAACSGEIGLICKPVPHSNPAARARLGKIEKCQWNEEDVSPSKRKGSVCSTTL